MAEDEWITGQVTLRVGNVPLDLEMTVPAQPVKPHRMLPIFHKMSEAFADIGVQAEAAEGKNVSCKAGCGACCSQAVPISEMEAYYIADVVNAMPEPRRTEIRERFARSLRHFRETGWFEALRSRKGRTWAGAEELVLEYFREYVPCPFLENGSCSIYEHRPRTCRTYDCRVFPATGLRVDDDDDKELIAQRAQQWQFSYPTPEGYPDTTPHWLGTLLWRWNFAVGLSENQIKGTKIDLTELRKNAGGDPGLTRHILGRQPTEDEASAYKESDAGLALLLASPAFQMC